MRKSQKEQILDTLELLDKAHAAIQKAIETKNKDAAMTLLEQCQDSAIQIGSLIEASEGEDFEAIAMLENYCEQIYQTYELVRQQQPVNAAKICKGLRKELIRIENSVKNGIKVRLEMVFLPYKVSMWDSLESIWMAADADSDCDAYVVPIPYYDKNQDGSLGAFHYEGDRFPSYVPVTHYNAYDLKKREPDAVFIHNPYDHLNRVTSVDPRFYSYELKKSTECLVYVPYFATSGGMSEAQASCIAYYFADYIVIQTEKFRKFYDSELPREKLVPLGSPKFDKVIRLCQDTPELPQEWKEKVAGKKVCFYNTSINGMLANTEIFLKKMEYVFRCFAKCEQACLLWRPHPLLESTFDSMRAEYKPFYEKLKRYFLESGLGIYDDTPEIEPTIAVCDAYIGDADTSVTALFGVAGKPLFLLNNRINSEPEEEDWRGEVIRHVSPYGNTRYLVTGGGVLFYDEAGSYRYRYAGSLCEYQSIYAGYYLSYAISVQGKDYVCPGNAQEILLLEGGKVVKRIELERYLEQSGAFCGAAACGKYLLLLPNKYPALVCYDTATGEISYFTEGIDVFHDETMGEKRNGGFCVWKDYLFLASPVNSCVSAIHVPTGKMQLMTTGVKSECGCAAMIPDGEEIWLLPYEGYIITRWNPESGEVREYNTYMEGLRCKHPNLGYECDTMPFSRPAVLEDALYLPPNQGNHYLCLQKDSGEISVWEPPFGHKSDKMNGYYPSVGEAALFFQHEEEVSKERWKLFTYADKKMYDLNLLTGEWREQPIMFQMEDIQKLAVGFDCASEWNQCTSCEEDAFHTLADFLQGTLPGKPFDPEQAKCKFAQSVANGDGTCGEKTYQFIKGKC